MGAQFFGCRCFAGRRTEYSHLCTECRTKLKWPLSATRAAEVLKGDFEKKQSNPAVVALDAQFEGSPETLRVLRPATILDTKACS